MTKYRTKLSGHLLSSLMTIKLLGVDVAHFDATEPIELWQRAKKYRHRLQNSATTEQETKARTSGESSSSSSSVSSSSSQLHHHRAAANVATVFGFDGAASSNVSVSSSENRDVVEIDNDAKMIVEIDGSDSESCQEDEDDEADDRVDVVGTPKKRRIDVDVGSANKHPRSH